MRRLLVLFSFVPTLTFSCFILLAVLFPPPWVVQKWMWAMLIGAGNLELVILWAWWVTKMLERRTPHTPESGEKR